MSAIGPNMANFGLSRSVPEKFKDRQFYEYNANVTLMRTTVEENRKNGEEIGRKAAAATGPTTILLPLQGVSAIDRTGQTFDDSMARKALLDAIRATHGGAEQIEIDNYLNDTTFAEGAARKLLELIARFGLLNRWWGRQPSSYNKRFGCTFVGSQPPAAIVGDIYRWRQQQREMLQPLFSYAGLALEI